MKIFSKLAAIAAVMSVAAISAANATKFEAKLASQDPPTTAKHRGLLKAAELIKARTNGEVEIKIFPSSQLGGGRQMIEGAQLGTIEMAITPAAFLGGFNPLVSVLDIPYILPSDRDISRKLRDGKFGQAVLASFRAKGVVPENSIHVGIGKVRKNRSILALDASATWFDRRHCLQPLQVADPA